MKGLKGLLDRFTGTPLDAVGGLTIVVGALADAGSRIFGSEAVQRLADVRDSAQTLAAFNFARLADVPEFFGDRLPYLWEAFNERDCLAEDVTWDGVVSLEVLISLTEVIISCFDDAAYKRDKSDVNAKIADSEKIQELIADYRTLRDDLQKLRIIGLDKKIGRIPIVRVASVPSGLILANRVAIVANLARVEGFADLLSGVKAGVDCPIADVNTVEQTFKQFVQSLQAMAPTFVAKMVEGGTLLPRDIAKLEEALNLMTDCNNKVVAAWHKK